MSEVHEQPLQFWIQEEPLTSQNSKEPQKTGFWKGLGSKLHSIQWKKNEPLNNTQEKVNTSILSHLKAIFKHQTKPSNHFSKNTSTSTISKQISEEEKNKKIATLMTLFTKCSKENGVIDSTIDIALKGELDICKKLKYKTAGGTEHDVCLLFLKELISEGSTTAQKNLNLLLQLPVTKNIIKDLCEANLVTEIFLAYDTIPNEPHYTGLDSFLKSYIITDAKNQINISSSLQEKLLGLINTSDFSPLEALKTELRGQISDGINGSSGQWKFKL